MYGEIPEENVSGADSGTESSVSDGSISPERFEDGALLTRAIVIFNRNRTQQNMIKVFEVLRDSFVWIPCNAVMSDADYAALERAVKDSGQNGGPDTLVGMTLTSQGSIRMIPDILQNGDEYFFPAFTTAAEMGEYGERFSKVEMHFLEAANLARNNETKVRGIVINAFSEPFIVPIELFDLIADIPSNFENEEEADNE